ncbi:MAG: iron transporter [Chloroflexi bacterium]|nr:iron transporter [Chloroflexota bacterium]
MRRFRLVSLIALATIVLGLVPQATFAEGHFQDPSKQTVLIGEANLADMRVKLELEPPKPMTMLMDGQWTEMAMAMGKYHVEVKPEDPKSNTRIPYAQVSFLATNQDTGHKVELDLHPMWGGSGLHYAANGDLPDGTYSATVIVGPPSFMRAGDDRQRWLMPTQADFEFTLDNGLLASAKVVEDAEMMKIETAPSEPMPGMPGMP